MGDSNIPVYVTDGGMETAEPHDRRKTGETPSPTLVPQEYPTTSTPDDTIDIAQELVLKELSEVLHRPVDHIDTTRSFVRHGGDSISAVKVIKACRNMGIHLSMATIMGSEHLSDVLRECQIQETGHWPGHTLFPHTNEWKPARAAHQNQVAGSGPVKPNTRIINTGKKPRNLANTVAPNGGLRHLGDGVVWPVAAGAHTPPRSRASSEGSLVPVEAVVSANSQVSPKTATPSPAHTNIVTEMQLALIQGSRANPGTNIIQLQDQCASQMVPVMRDAWQRVLSLEPIFRARFADHPANDDEGEQDSKLDGDDGNRDDAVEAGASGVLEGISDTFELDWEEVMTYDSDTFQNEIRQPSRSGLGSQIECSFKVVTLKRGGGRRSLSSRSTIIWSVHHALVDGYSAKLLYDKVLHVVNNQPDSCVLPGTSFFEVAHRLKELQLQENAATEAKTFWKGIAVNFSNAMGTLHLPSPPTPQDKPGNQTSKVETASVSMSRLVDPVSTPSRSGVSIAALFHAAWALVLSLYTDSDHVVFGAVFACRSLPIDGVEDTIGALINTLPLFVKVDPSMPTSRFLNSVFKQMIKLDSIQYSNPKDGYSRSAFSTALAEEIELPASPFSAGQKPTFEITSEIPLRILFNHNGGFRICYDPSLYRASDIQDMAECLKRAILSLLAPGTVDTALGQLVDYDTRHMLRDMGNFLSEDTTYDSVQHDLVTLFEKAVQYNPCAIALERDGFAITYQSLDDMAGQVAAYLSPRIDPGDVVCVSADGSLGWIVAVYGILKAGGVYSPLSHKLPTQVRDENFRTTGAKIFVAPTATDAAALKPRSCGHSFSVEEVLSTNLNRSGFRHRVQPLPWADAYVCFTSGSTGKPKGVVCTHAGLVAFQRDPEVRLFAGPGVRVAQLMSPAFDGSVHEVFSALSYGATLVLGPESGDLGHLGMVDSVLCTPSMVRELDPGDFPRLKQLYMVGEAVPQRVSDLWSGCDGGRVRVYNMYGPTEATCGATIQRLRLGKKVNIGGPNGSSRLYILDRRGRMVPPGVVGEVHIGGVQVSRGYIGREEETRKKFRVDNICPHPGEMMYQTGDRGYWNGYGEVELLGRRDRQVKLRGFRVNLNDVEVRVGRVLKEGHAELEDGHGSGMVAVAVEGKAEYLVAMVEGNDVDVDDLRARVASVLPAHCLPKYYVAVDKLPLTPIGKVDYKAVVEMIEQERTKRSSGGETPERLEREMMNAVAGVWRQVLLLDDGVEMGTGSNFVALGGYSLQQMMVANRLSHILGVKVTHAQVMQARCLGDLVTLLEALTAGQKVLARSPHLVEPSEPSLPSVGQLAPIEMDWWEKYQTKTGTPTFNVNFVCALDNTVDKDSLVRAWDDVLARHEMLRCRYRQNCRGEVRRVYVDSPPQTTRTAEIDVKAEINKEFDLSSDHLVRVTIADHRMVVVISHIICDLTTLQILLGEVQALYQGDRLVHAPRPYDRRAAWDRTVIASDLKFWRETLMSLPPSPFEGIGRNLQRKGYGRGKSALFKLPGSVADAFFEICKKGHTSHQVALGAVALALGVRGTRGGVGKEVSGVDIVLGGPYLGRAPEDHGTVGLFLEPLPFRIQCSGLRRIYPHPAHLDIPVDYIVLDSSGDSQRLLPRDEFLQAVKQASTDSITRAVPWSTLLSTLDVPTGVASDTTTMTTGATTTSTDTTNSNATTLADSAADATADTTLAPAVQVRESPPHTSAKQGRDVLNGDFLDIMVTFHTGDTTLRTPQGVTPLVTWTEGAKFKLMVEFTALGLRGGGSKGVMLRTEWDTDVLGEEEVRGIVGRIFGGVIALGGVDRWEGEGVVKEMEEGEVFGKGFVEL